MPSIQPLIQNFLSGDTTALATLSDKPTAKTLLEASIIPFHQFMQDRHLPPACWDTLWDTCIPLAENLLTAAHTTHPLTIGFLGGQGTGKTTLTQILALLLATQDKTTASFSLDDLYLTYADRQALSDRRLIWRGPPGTHDIDLGLQTLASLKAQRPHTDIPWFDKSLHSGQGDRGPSKTTGPVDFILFEGWFVGAQPLPESRFDPAVALPEPIVSAADRTFARDMNQNLHQYLPLWAQLDRLVVLHVPDYPMAKIWRKQAEHELIAQGKTGMSDDEIDRFVEYFWKALHPELFIAPLTKPPAKPASPKATVADWIIEVGPNHQHKSLRALSCPN